MIAASPSRKPHGINQKTSKAKKLIPNEATASPRTWAGTSSTSMVADSGPFMLIASGGRDWGRITIANREPGARESGPGGRRGDESVREFGGRCRIVGSLVGAASGRRGKKDDFKWPGGDRVLCSSVLGIATSIGLQK